MKKKILALGMAAISAATLFSGCGNKKAPDYSSSNLQYNFYAYSAAIDGWNIDGVSYSSGNDYKTVERIRRIKQQNFSSNFRNSNG